MKKLFLSSLPKTWIIDIDGVIFEHNKYKELQLGEDETPLPGVVDFFRRIGKSDFVILVTSRDERYRERTERSLKKADVCYNVIIMNLPVGERVVINDRKPSRLDTAFAINLRRNDGLKSVDIVVDKEK